MKYPEAISSPQRRLESPLASPLAGTPRPDRHAAHFVSENGRDGHRADHLDAVVLVDDRDREIGSMPKLEAHLQGALHRAFSVFVFNGAGEILLQRRAANKYHSGGLWSNTCCSHPRPGEPVSHAAHRRLREEMGMTCSLESAFSFVYRSYLDNGITEHEVDHVFVGRADYPPTPDPSEVSDWRCASIDVVRQELERDAGRFTTWFRICFERTAAVIQSFEGTLRL